MRVIASMEDLQRASGVPTIFRRRPEGSAADVRPWMPESGWKSRSA